MSQTPQEITALLKASATSATARQAVYELVYSDLRRLARNRIRASRPGQTLSVTSLVNEAYLKLAAQTGNAWNDREHFLRVAATAMRQITVDYVRSKLTDKRGGGVAAFGLTGLNLKADDRPAMVLALDEALQRLAVEQPRLVQVVECRFFAGLTIPETAAALKVSTRTVERDWDQAREWLLNFLS